MVKKKRRKGGPRTSAYVDVITIYPVSQAPWEARRKELKRGLVIRRIVSVSPPGRRRRRRPSSVSPPGRRKRPS